MILAMIAARNEEAFHAALSISVLEAELEVMPCTSHFPSLIVEMDHW